MYTKSLSKKGIIFIYLLLHIIILNGCNEEEIFGGPKRSIGSFWWQNDSKGILAEISSNLQRRMTTFDLSGTELSSYELSASVPKYLGLIEEDFFIGESQRNIISFTPPDQIDVLRQNENLVSFSYLPNEVITYRYSDNTTDSGWFFLNSFIGRNIIPIKEFSSIGKVRHPNIQSPYFLSDSLYATETSISGIGVDSIVLNIYNRSEQLLHSFVDFAHETGVHSKNILLGTSKNRTLLEEINLNTFTRKVLGGINDYPVSFRANDSGTKLYYMTYITNKDFRYTLYVLDLVTMQEKVLATDVIDKYKLSPDGKHLAFFVYRDRDLKLQILQTE